MEGDFVASVKDQCRGGEAENRPLTQGLIQSISGGASCERLAICRRRLGVPKERRPRRHTQTQLRYSARRARLGEKPRCPLLRACCNRVTTLRLRGPDQPQKNNIENPRQYLLFSEHMCFGRNDPTVQGVVGRHNNGMELLGVTLARLLNLEKESARTRNPHQRRVTLRPTDGIARLTCDKGRPRLVCTLALPTCFVI